MLFVVMTIVGLVTYSVVFNLNNLVQSVSAAYNYLRTEVLHQMKSDGESWQELYKRFDGFRLQRLYSLPSEWWIFWYILLWPYKRAVRLCMGMSDGEANSDSADSDLTDASDWLKEMPPDLDVKPPEETASIHSTPQHIPDTQTEAPEAPEAGTIAATEEPTTARPSDEPKNQSVVKPPPEPTDLTRRTPWRPLSRFLPNRRHQVHGTDGEEMEKKDEPTAMV
jgi:hypothetical protein